MKLLLIESIILCLLFTIMVFIFSRKPIKTLYNYPPNIIERIKSLPEYKDEIPTNKNKLTHKLIAVILFTIIIALLLRYINGYTSFKDSFINGFILWTIVNLYDAIVLDIIWFCHDPYFVIKGSEDMVDDYHDYIFHLKGFLIGEIIGLIVCVLASLLVIIFK